MEIYENEHDQVDAIKRFFVENGKALVVGVVLGIGALVGWRAVFQKCASDPDR